MMIRTLLLASALLAATPAIAQLNVTKRADIVQPIVLAPGQAAVIVGFRRPDAMSMGKSGLVVFGRYDIEKRDLVDRPRDAKKNGDTTTYSISVHSGDRKLPLDHAIMLVSAGDYVLLGAAPGAVPGVTNSFCFGAPTFHVGAGEVVYFGDLTPYLGVRMADPNNFAPPTPMGIKAISDNIGSAMAYSSHSDDARAALSAQPALAKAFKPAHLRNGATYGCFAQEMTAYIVPGVESLVAMTSAQANAARPNHRLAPTTPAALPTPTALPAAVTQ